MADDTQPKRRGRPKKDPNAPKASYNISRAERARRETQKRVRLAKKRAVKTTKLAEDKRHYARKIEQSAKRV
jgi:hypothetical protein